MQILPRALAGLSGLLLLVDAYLHSTGTAAVREALTGDQVPEFFAHALPIIWLFFSWHLVAMAAPLLWASITNPSWFLPATFFCGLVALGDFFWVYSAAGWFPGTVVLFLVVAALGATTIVLARGRSATAT